MKIHTRLSRPVVNPMAESPAELVAAQRAQGGERLAAKQVNRGQIRP